MLKISVGFIILPSQKPPLIQRFFAVKKKNTRGLCVCHAASVKVEYVNVSGMGHFLGGHTPPSGWGGWILWKCWVFFKNLKKELLYPQKKEQMSPKMGPQFKRNFQETCLFSGEKKLLPFTSAPEKNPWEKKNNGWIIKEGLVDTKFTFPLLGGGFN